jgi:hypothetical protein
MAINTQWYFNSMPDGQGKRQLSDIVTGGSNIFQKMYWGKTTKPPN